MANYGPNVFQIKVTTTSSTASFRDISQQCYTFSGLQVEAILEAAHSFGDAWEESMYVGVNRIGKITLGGRYDDDTSTGVAGIFGYSTDLGAQRKLKLNFAGTTGTTAAGTNVKFDVFVESFKKSPARGAITPFEVVLQPSSALAYTTTT